MDAAGAAGGLVAIDVTEIEELFNSLGLQGPLAQVRLDFIVPHLISLLPPPIVPAPDHFSLTSSDDDDHFSLTSSESDDDGAAAGALVPASQDDGQDHIGGLADDLLSNIISRLPTKEAARTMVLSTRWRFVWAATPLLLDDAHLRLGDAEGPRKLNAVRAVSRCVAAHPGPVRAVRITRLSFHQQEYALQRLVASLAAKNVQDLILFNRRWPLDMPLPDDIRSCASLSRLYIGIWRWPFPDTTAHRPAFPNLHELGIFHTIIEDKEVDALLAHCPKLKILSYAMAYNGPSRLRVKSGSLRVVMEWKCRFDEVIIDDAPCLERLLFDSIGEQRPIKIVHAPRLEVLGFLDLKLHTLEIGGIVIRAGMIVRASAMLPSLKILAVKVRFWNDMEAKMLPTLLRCFPRLETLHIMSIQSKSPDNVDDMDFWKSLASCDCLESHLKVFVFHGYHSRSHEVALIGYIFKNAKVLKIHGFKCRVSEDVAVEGSDGSSSSDDVVVEEGPVSSSVGVDNALSGGSSSSDDEVMEGGSLSGSVGEGNLPSCGSNSSDDVAAEGGPVSDIEGNAPSGGTTGRYIFACPAYPCWSFQNAIDLSVDDPFFKLRHDYAAIVHLVDRETPC